MALLTRGRDRREEAEARQADSLRDQSRVLHVSTGVGDKKETARHYWQAALGSITAHMVHYDESSFATVFTDGGSPDEVAALDDAGKEVIVEAARGELDGKVADGDMLMYLGVMSLADAESFAAQAQAVLEEKFDQ